MNEKIGQFIKRIAESQGLSQQQVGNMINKTKQGVASIYRRSTIDTELLKALRESLNYDFFAHFYNEEPLSKFKQMENASREKRIDRLEQEIKANVKLLESKEELLTLQRKYIFELEAKKGNKTQS